jgi:TatD DNase family protein
VIPESLQAFIDTHCHLNLEEFDQDRQQLIEDAWEKGIRRIVIPGLDIETSQSAIKYAADYTQVFAAVGFHPNTDRMWTDECIAELSCLAHNIKVVAIGEIGLDYYRNHSPGEYQRKVFTRQLELAAQLELPVIVHNRDASPDMAEILIPWHDELTAHNSKLAEHPGVLHAFSGDIQFAQKMTQINFKLGIGGAVTFRNAKILHAVVKTMPLQDLLLETDAPFMSPHPLRGRRNEPVNVRIVAEKIAELKAITVDEVGKITTEEAGNVFNWRTTQ